MVIVSFLGSEWEFQVMQSLRLTCLAVLSAVTCAGGCAEPIKTEYYSRTPPTEPQWRPSRPVSSMRVGIGAESMEDGGTFAAYASGLGAFEYIGWARPELVPNLDCQVECAVSFEHSGDKQVHYCLGRLVANIYTADHSALLDRVVHFHEAMYTSESKRPQFTHDGQDVHKAVRERLFDELIACFGN